MSRYNEVLSEVMGGINQKFVFGSGKGGKLWLKLSPEIPKTRTAATTNAAAKDNAGGN